MFNKHLPLLHGNVSILPEVRFFLPADAGNGAVQRQISRKKCVCCQKSCCAWAASSPSQSKPNGFDSSPKGRALGSPHKLHLYAKASPLEERLPPRRGKMSRSDKRGNLANAVSLRGFTKDQQTFPSQRDRFRRKQALQMPFSSTTPLVKRQFWKICRFSRIAK